MKKMRYLIAGILLFASSGLMAQDSTFFANNYAKGLALLRKAQEYGDGDMEKKALFELLVLNERDTTILQGLASYYYNSGKFTNSILVGLDYLQKYPGNLYALKTCAQSYEQLRVYDKSIQFYEDWYLRSDDVKLLYQIAYLQFLSKKFDESLNNISILEARNVGGTLDVNRQDNTLQKVPFKAVILNLKGLVSFEQGNKTVAKGHFEEALKLAPDFEAAKRSLDEVNKG